MKKYKSIKHVSDGVLAQISEVYVCVCVQRSTLLLDPLYRRRNCVSLSAAAIR